MSGAEVALPIAMKGIQAASGAGGKGGGGSSSPGASPEQASLAQYHFGENLVKNRSNWAGMPSTGETFGAAGAHNQLAKELAQASDVNQQQQAIAGQQLQQLAQQQSQQQSGNQQFSSGVQSTQGGNTFNT